MNDMQEGIMHFTKWQACGNDFVFVNAMTMDIRPVVKKCVSICNRNFGIGDAGIKASFFRRNRCRDFIP